MDRDDPILERLAAIEAEQISEHDIKGIHLVLEQILIRLDAFEAENAKTRERVERLERLLTYALNEVQQIALEPLPPWAIALRDALQEDLAERDRA